MKLRSVGAAPKRGTRATAAQAQEVAIQRPPTFREPAQLVLQAALFFEWYA